MGLTKTVNTPSIDDAGAGVDEAKVERQADGHYVGCRLDLFL